MMNIDLDFKTSTGTSLLHLLSQMKSTSEISKLILKFKFVDPKDNLGETPLHKSCLSRNFESAKILLQNGANANEVNNAGQTPLMILAKHKKNVKKCFWKLLLDHNANPLLENNDKFRAVDILRINQPQSPALNMLHPMYSQI